MDGNDIPRRKKRKVKKETLIKLKKVKGEEHLNHSGRIITKRTTGPDCKCHHLKCFEVIDEFERQRILSQFNNFESKNAQDSHLCGLISFHKPVRRRPRKRQVRDMDTDSESENEVTVTEKFENTAFYEYKVRVKGEEVKVCSRAFLSLHGITRSRVRRIQESLLQNGQAPIDLRGKHNNRANKTPDAVTFLIKEHIESFKVRKSHYSQRVNPNRRYLPETLNVSIMHKMFLEKYWINVSYQVYHAIFTQDYNIHFGLPRSDTCSICDSLQMKINSSSDEIEKNAYTVEKTLHIKKAEKFRELKRTYKNKALEGEVTMLSFDFMQNLPLPHIRTSDVFYARQLWYFVFGIHDVATRNASMMVYDEITGKKGQNDVTSLLFKYLVSVEHNTPNLCLISDGCSGQNKNYVMVKFLYMLVHCLNLYQSILYIFPVRGHTYLPNDQDFSLIGIRKKIEDAESKEDWNNIIRSARTKPAPFNLVEVTQDDLFNIKDCLSPYFLKKTKPLMKLKGVKMLKICKNVQHVSVKHTYSGMWQNISIRNKTPLPDELILKKSYESPIPLKPSKLADLQRLSNFLKNPESKCFYENLRHLNNNDNGVENVEISCDENSSGEDE